MTIYQWLVSALGTPPSGLEFIYYIGGMVILCLSIALFLRFIYGAVTGLFFR